MCYQRIYQTRLDLLEKSPNHHTVRRALLLGNQNDIGLAGRENPLLIKWIQNALKKQSRAHLSLLCFAGYAILYATRFNLSVGIISMVNTNVLNSNITSECVVVQNKTGLNPNHFSPFYHFKTHWNVSKPTRQNPTCHNLRIDFTHAKI